MPRNFLLVRTPEGEKVRIAARGRGLLGIPMINRGTAFTLDERRQLGLTGLLPSRVSSIETQVRRVYKQYQMAPGDLGKYLMLEALQERNLVLYYRLLSEHIEEMLPIIYTPTVGRAIQEFSRWFSKPKGLFLSIDQPEDIEASLQAWSHRADDVDLIVVTDSEGILGIGDQGVGGVSITVGKLAVYTAAAGIHPHRVLPVVLDTGTDNLDLLSDENYLGARHGRVRGERYDAFIDQFVKAATKLYPKALLHWEDFSADNAHRILTRYREEICTFNDDIQGTAAVVVAAALAACRRTRTKLSDHRIVIHGAGTAGIGIADLMVDIMVSEGLPEHEARAKFWGLGSRGLLREGTRLRDFQERFARPASEVDGWAGNGSFDLADVVATVRPTMLIGTSAQPGAFTEQVVTEMARHCEQPVIMPLSNPTSKSEAQPVDIVRWTNGRALIATGSPFAPVEHNGVVHEIAQANNALVFPGLGLGVVVSRATRVTDHMIAAAARAAAAAVTRRTPGSPILPSVANLRSVSARVALEVAAAAAEEGVATVELTDPVQDVMQSMWVPNYPEVEVI
ncbi:NAD-dependent malic enzyme [Aestuariimicrobium soli]|uniref:NAD-dependent malic enzyme n=1 Tax=Aestuariimicrobium soli TaxID=2035834 RepID=UPI003EC0129E